MSSKSSTELRISFDNEEALRLFMDWLQNHGEEAYWEAMHEKEFEEEGDITVLQFSYDFSNHKIKTLLGRLDDC
jgi:hypothetical protein